MDRSPRLHGISIHGNNSAYNIGRFKIATNQFPYDGKGVRIEPFPRQSDVDALRTRVTDLELILVDLIDRIDRNGGLGEYKGGSAFVLKRARELLLGADASP